MSAIRAFISSAVTFQFMFECVRIVDIVLDLLFSVY